MKSLICFLLALSFLLASGDGLLAQGSGDSILPRCRQHEKTQAGSLQKYCLDCHSAAEKQGELDLERFRSVADMRRDVVPWQRVVEMMDDGEMPPKEAEAQPSKAEHTALRNWVRSVLDADAKANAGDPGPVVLRRLNNAEFTYTVQDLTGVPLEPAREFPVDSAAGEGFTNVGNALVMSPALVQKYLDAGKDIASHAMLLPHGIEFSPKTTSRDWTNQRLDEIRKFYARYSDSGGATAVNLQGIQFETNGGGRLPLELYLRATLIERDAMQAGSKSTGRRGPRVFAQRKISDHAVDCAERLNSRHWCSIWFVHNGVKQSRTTLPALVATIAQWQQTLWRFTTIGHIGKRDGPTAWQVPVQPLAARQEIRTKLPAPQDGKNITLYLATSDASDGNEHDVAVWENPRFVAAGQPDLLLRDVRHAVATLSAHREVVLSSAAACLEAAAEAGPTADAAAD